MKLKVLRQRDTDLKAAIAAKTRERADIGTAAVADNRAMTADERTKFVALGPEIEALKAQLAENDELLAAAEAANEAVRAYQAPVVAADPAPVVQASVGADLTTKAPGYFGRQLQAVRKAAMTLRGGDERLTAEDIALLKPMQAAATGANTDVPSEGGFLVPSQVATGIIQRAYTQGEVLSRVNRLPIGPGFNGAKLHAIDETSRADNSRFGGLVSGWLGQGNALTSGKPKFRDIDLKLRKVGAFVYATDEMLADAVLFEAWVNRYVPMELQFRAEDAVINGVGSNQPLGVLNNPAVITVTRSTASRILADDLRAMVNRMWAPLWSNAAFFVDQSTLGEFDTLAVPVGTGGSLDPSYKPAGSTPGQVYATYKNIPIIPVEYCAALGTSGDIILVNLGEYLLIDKGSVDAAVSMHVAFLTDESVYRFMYRVDGQLSWNAAMTPKSGGSTLSCAIILS